MDGCPCGACSGGLSRGYLRYLVKNKELTGALAADAAQPRLHRARLMAGLRGAIADGTLPAYAAAQRAGQGARRPARRRSPTNRVCAARRVVVPALLELQL